MYVYIHTYIYISISILTVLGLWGWAFSSWSKWGLLSGCRAQTSHCSGFHCCGAWVLERWASAVVVHGLVATESSQTRGWTHVPRIGRRILTTGPPGKSKLTTVLNEHWRGNFPRHQKIWAVLSSSITNTILEKTIKVRYERHFAQRILWGCPNRFCTISSLCALWICTSNCVFILGVSQIISLQLKMA